MSHRIEFGFAVPIFANPGMSFFRTPCYEALDWKTTKDAVARLGLGLRFGFDQLEVLGHTALGPGFRALGPLVERRGRIAGGDVVVALL